MSHFKEFIRFANRNAVISLTGLAFAGLLGPAGAAGNENIVPVKLATNAPGMIRTDTCARPAYPDQDAKKNHHASVTLRLLIGTDGKPKQSLLVKSSGYPALDEATLVAISKCSFNPPMADDKPVEAWVLFRYDWTPQ